jgi:AraC-like DNA-binding protein
MSGVHQHSVLIFCHQGGGRLDMAGRHVFAAGSLLQIPGWMVHRVRFQQGAHYSVSVFDADRFPRDWTYSLESQRVAPAVLALPGLESMFERWQDRPEELLPRLAPQLPVTRLPDHVQDALAQAHQAASLGEGAGDISERLGYSLPYLTTQVRRHTGRSLGRWVQDSRLDRAALLLQTGRTTVAQVAQSCGYVDLSHFRRAFKKRTGQVPSQFQQEVKYEHV